MMLESGSPESPRGRGTPGDGECTPSPPHIVRRRASQPESVGGSSVGGVSPEDVAARALSRRDSASSQESSVSGSPGNWQSGLGLRKAWKFHMDSAKRMLETFGEKFQPPKEQEQEQERAAEQVEGRVGSAEFSGEPGTPMKRRNSTGSIGSRRLSTASVSSQEGGGTWARPIARAFNDTVLQPGRVMGRRLAEVWDIHDLFEDVKQQREFLKTKAHDALEVHRANNASAKAVSADDAPTTSTASTGSTAEASGSRWEIPHFFSGGKPGEGHEEGGLVRTRSDGELAAPASKWEFPQLFPKLKGLDEVKEEERAAEGGEQGYGLFGSKQGSGRELVV